MHLSIKTGKLELETAAAPSLATKADDNGAKGGQGGAASFSLFLFLFFFFVLAAALVKSW